MRSTYDRARRQRGGGRVALPLPAGGRLQRDARRGGAGRAVLRPVQPLARLARGTTWWTGPTTSCGRHRRRTRPSRSRGRCSCRRRCFRRPLTWTWSTTKGADLIVGADRVRAVVPHGVLADVLRHRVLHLPPVSCRGRSCRGRSRRGTARRRRSGGRAGADRARSGTDLAPAEGDATGSEPASRRRRSSRPTACCPSKPAGDGAGDRALGADGHARSTSRRSGSASRGTVGRRRRSMRRCRCSSAPARSTTATDAEYLVKAFPVNVGTRPIGSTWRATSRCRSSGRRRSSWSAAEGRRFRTSS